MSVYAEALDFRSRYPLTIAWRLKKNADVIQMHLNEDEEVVYVFCGQHTKKPFDFFSSCVIAITTKRILIGRKRVLFGYCLDSVMPYMFNDLNIRGGVFWGKVCIDTAKEVVVISKVDVNAMDEIETAISQNMMKLKKEYEDGD